MNIDDYTKGVDELLTANEIKMMVTFPEKSMEADIQANVPPSPVLQFYIMLHAMKKIFGNILKLDVIDESKKEELIDAMLGLLKEGILDEEM